MGKEKKHSTRAIHEFWFLFRWTRHRYRVMTSNKSHKSHWNLTPAWSRRMKVTFSQQFIKSHSTNGHPVVMCPATTTTQALDRKWWQFASVVFWYQTRDGQGYDGDCLPACALEQNRVEVSHHNFRERHPEGINSVDDDSPPSAERSQSTVIPNDAWVWKCLQRRNLVT